MTNEQIIAQIAARVYGEETVLQMIEEGKEIPLHTVQGWASRGPYRVKKGEHGIECQLWKKKKRKEKQEESQGEENTIDSTNKDFYLCKSYLFKEDQVEVVSK